MTRFVEGEDRRQATLLPSCLDDYVAEDNPARVIDVFVDELDLRTLAFEVIPAITGRPAYHPSTLLKLYIYGYLNRVQSSRRLEREEQRNVDLMWLTGKLAPDHKTIANFRKDNGLAIQAAGSQFVVRCREIGLFSQAVAAVVRTLHAAALAPRPGRHQYAAKLALEALSVGDERDHFGRHRGPIIAPARGALHRNTHFSLSPRA